MPVRAHAVPTFARKYETSCLTCHRQFPRLNEVGETFRLRGYRFVDDASLTKGRVVSMGRKAFEKLFPEAVWPSDMPAFPPISARLVSDFTVDATGSRPARTQFEAPHTLDFHVAGTMGEHIAFWGEVELELEDRSVVAQTGGWLQFGGLLHTGGAVNLRLGRVGRSGMGLFTARDSNRLTWTHYLYGRWRLPYPEGFAAPNRFRLHASQPGLEVFGFGRRWQYSFGVANGGDGGNRDESSAKDVYGQLTLKLGGLGFDGVAPTTDDAASPRSSWLMVDVFAYRGWASVRDGEEDQARTDAFWQVGAGIAVDSEVPSLAATGGCAVGRNSNPYARVTPAPASSRSCFLEAQWGMFPWLLSVVRYETLSMRLPEIAGLGRRHEWARGVVSLGALVRANVRLVLEGRWWLSGRNGSDRIDSRESDAALLRLDFAV